VAGEGSTPSDTRRPLCLLAANGTGVSDREQERRRAANRERKRAEKRALVVIALLAFLVALVWIVKAAAHPRPFPRAWLAGALCIHEREASWRDAGAPYFGGMQMDRRFMATYGRRLLRSKGTAEHWSPHQQLHVARRGWRARGWRPWPVAARRCGLL
jgi:hypothetical protein